MPPELAYEMPSWRIEQADDRSPEIYAAADFVGLSKLVRVKHGCVESLQLGEWGDAELLVEAGSNALVDA